MPSSFHRCDLLTKGAELEICNYVVNGVHLWALGTSVGWGIHGVLVTLGIICFKLLGARKGEGTRLQKFLRGYIVLLLLANVTFAAVDLARTIIMVATIISGNLPRHIMLYEVGLNSITAVIAILCDGLLIWRCYKVQKALAIKHTAIQNVFWIFPLIMSLFGVVLHTLRDKAIGIAGIQIRRRSSPENKIRSDMGQRWPYTTALLSNIIVNLSTTSFLVVRLLMHRQMIKRHLGCNALGEHFRIIGILLESAALNIPTTIVAVTGIATHRAYGSATMAIIVPAQSLASVLVIYQVAVRRTIEWSIKGEEEQARRHRPI